MGQSPGATAAWAPLVSQLRDVFNEGGGRRSDDARDHGGNGVVIGG
eukprot:SAG25_NODE_559_length_6924_cov_15.045421_6_plen_46_part_00